ncbi:MAG: hypothetical protein ACWA42_09525 [Lutibacter sp.]
MNLKHISIIVFLAFFSNKLIAQQGPGQRIRLLKTSYITQAIDLAPSEAEQFWPIYNLYTKKLQKLKMANEVIIKQKINQVGGIDFLSDQAANEILNTIKNNEKEISATKIEMITKLQKVISAKKILLLHKAERSFNRRMLQELGKRRGRQ